LPGKKFKSKIVFAVANLVLLLIVAEFAIFAGFGQAATSESNNYRIATNSVDLLQYEWPQLSGDSSFSRYSAGPAPEAPDILWKTNITDIQSHISAFDGKIFVCSHTTVYALDYNLGNILWSTVIPNPGPWPSVYKIDSSHMVVGNSCLDPETGTILWTSNVFAATSEPLFTFNVYSPEEKMFYTKEGSFIQAWDFSNPNQEPVAKWRTYVSGSGKTGSGIQYGDGKVYPGAFESHQVAINAKTGDIVWDTETTGSLLFSGSYSDGKFFRGGTHDNTLYAFDTNTGEILWRFNPGTDDGYWSSGTAVAYGIVYALNKDGNLYAVDADTGSVIWSYRGPGSLMFPGTPTVADGKIYATTGQEASYGGVVGASEFACLDAYTGQVIWKLPIEAFAPRESVIVAYGNLYLIPGDVTQSVDSISGNEYSTVHQIWAMSTTNWAMYRHDAANSAAGQSGPSNLNLRWTFATQGSVVSSPSIANGIAYFGSQDKNIYAVNAQSGSLLWKFETQARIGSSPAVANDKVYSGTDDGYLYCLDAYNGTMLWKQFTGGFVEANFAASVMLRSSPTIVEDHVYVGALDNNTYCLNVENGDIKWAYQTNGYITSTPAVVNGAVYITSQEPGSGRLYKLNAADGNQIWNIALPYFPTFMGGIDMHSSPVVADGMVFAASSTSAYYGINSETGEKIWEYIDPTAEEFIICSPVYNDGVLYLINKFSIVALDAKTGTTTWSSFIGDELYVSPTYADGKLYIATDQRHLYILNATSGEKINYHTFNSNSWASPSIYEGRVYLGNNDWNVYCFSEYPALSSSLSINLSISEVRVGELASGNGQLSPGISNATITITLSKPDGTVSRIQTKTAAKGGFIFSFVPDAEGDWTISAQWLVDKSYYTSSGSESVLLTVSAPISPTNSGLPTPGTTPIHSASNSPTIPWDQQKIGDIPMLYIYVAIIAVLVIVIAIAGSVYLKNSKTDKGIKIGKNESTS